MLQTKQNGKSNPTVEKGRLLPGQNDGQHQKSVKETIVLEMNVIDNQQAGRKENRKSSDICQLFIGLGGRLDIAELVYQSLTIRSRGSYSPVQCINKDKLRKNHRSPLKAHRLPGVIIEVLHVQHCRVRKACCLGQHPFECREKRRVIECPFRSVLQSQISESGGECAYIERTS